MTREEAIHFANCLKNNYTVDLDDMEAFCDEAIKALKQEPILDKIRAEIAVLDDADYDYEGYYKAVTDALKILDKYKAESEKA